MERRPHVLVVEDEPLLGEMISGVLRDDGFSVHVAASASEALLYLLSGERVDVLFTDIDLPGGMDGGSLALRARQLKPGLPVVYASGKPGGLRHVVKVPGSIFLEKPYRPDEASALLAQMSALESEDA